MKVAYIVSECVPFVKTGGLADVAGALPKALEKIGCEVKVFLPLYSSIDTFEFELVFCEDMHGMSIDMDGRQAGFHAWSGKLPGSGVEIYFIENSDYFHRNGPYTSDSDEDERFVFFQLATFDLMRRLNWSPDVIHANDWETGLMPALLNERFAGDSLFNNTATIFSIHNIGYHGLFGRAVIAKAGLSDANFYPGGPLEFRGEVSFLKAGIEYADIINTVSDTHAQEIQTEQYGAGLEGVLQRRRDDLFGILNGIDTDDWNPETDLLIPHNYTHKSIENKIKNKKSLLKSALMSNGNDDMALIGLITRLTPQKGIDLVRKLIDKLMDLPVKIIALGNGNTELEDFLRLATKTYNGRFAGYIGYNEELAHLITAGSDMFLMPSVYEPCGLNQMYSLNYGTVPIVRKTGGLNDTVRDYHEFYGEGNGFTFNEYNADALYRTIQRALDLFSRKDEWEKIMCRGMRENFSWDRSAFRYKEIYRMAIEKRWLANQ
jgi:starch synthase